jgi:lysophospholipase L1-like esterase
MIRRRKTRALALIAVAIAVSVAVATALASCASASPGAASPTPSASSAALVLVAIGDSIPVNSSDDCPGCTGFVETVGAELEALSGRPVILDNRSRHDGAQTQDIADQLVEDDALIEILGTADVVIASFGFNDQPPYVGGDGSCPPIADGASDDVAFAAMATTTTECVDAQTAALGELGQTVLDRLRALAPDAEIAVLNAYDSWRGWKHLSEYPALESPITATVAYALSRWDATVCPEAESIDAICVDLYSRFNGEDGLTPSGSLLATDYAHPSQEGNDAIAKEIINSGLLDEFSH